MMTQIQLLEACRLKTHKQSWYAVEKALQVGQARLFHYRKKGVFMPDAACVQVADFLGLPRDYVLVCVAAEKAGATPSGDALRALADMIEGARIAA